MYLFIYLVQGWDISCNDSCLNPGLVMLFWLPWAWTNALLIKVGFSLSYLMVFHSQRDCTANVELQELDSRERSPACRFHTEKT